MKLLVIGSNGQVGWELVRSLQPLGTVISIDRHRVDLADLKRLETVIRKIAPNVIINAAAYTAVDRAEENETLAFQINGRAPEVLASEAKRSGALLVHYSTDYVFDGAKGSAYTEEDPPCPINVYGHSKLMGEEAVHSVGPDYLILRLSWIYAARGSNFLRTILRISQKQDALSIVTDQVGAPTWARLVAESTAHVIRQSQFERGLGSFRSGLFHLAAAGETSWFGFAQAIIEQARRFPEMNIALKELTAIPGADYPTAAQRPVNSCLSSAKLEEKFTLQMAEWKQSLVFCMDEVHACVQGI